MLALDTDGYLGHGSPEASCSGTPAARPAHPGYGSVTWRRRAADPPLSRLCWSGSSRRRAPRPRIIRRDRASSIPAALPSPQVQTGTMADLQEALARWHRVAATVVYRTARQRPGLPSAAHQCLRQLVDDRADIPIAQAKCDPAGVARLLWHPPARWRLEVTEANRTVSATVDEEHSVVCARANGGKERCRRRSSDRLVRSFPFHELVTDVRSVLDELGIDGLGPVTVTHRRVGTAAADCFVRASGESSAEWCFGSDGNLLGAHAV